MALESSTSGKGCYCEERCKPRPLWKDAMDLAWPAFVELVMTTLFGMINMIMVGQLGPSAIASVGLTNQPFMLLLSVFAALNVGTTALVAWNIGAGDIKKAKIVTRQVLVIGLTLGIMVSILGILSARYIIAFMGAEADTIDTATLYFKIISAGLVFQVLTLAITAALRGAGETKIPMLYNICANLLNVFGNYILIYGRFGIPALGVAGAATSTDIARMITCFIGLYILFFSKRSKLSLNLKGDYRPKWNIIKQVFSIGIPSALEQFLLQSGLILFARTVSGLGTAVYAAHQIGLNINGLTFSPSQAFGVATTTLVGQSLGAGDTQKAERYADVVHRIGMIVACFIGVMFVLFSYDISRLYTADVSVAAMAGLVLKIMAIAQPGQSTQLVLAGALRGAGDTIFPLYASFCGIWIFRVVMAYIFVNIFGWGLVGAWVSMVLDQYTRSLIIYWRYHSGKWKYIKMRTSNLKDDRKEATQLQDIGQQHSV